MAGQKSDTRPGTGDWERVGVQVRPHTNTRVASSVSCFSPQESKRTGPHTKNERAKRRAKRRPPHQHKVCRLFLEEEEENVPLPRPPLLDRFSWRSWCSLARPPWSVAARRTGGREGGGRRGTTTALQERQSHHLVNLFFSRRNPRIFGFLYIETLTFFCFSPMKRHTTTLSLPPPSPLLLSLSLSLSISISLSLCLPRLSPPPSSRRVLRCCPPIHRPGRRGPWGRIHSADRRLPFTRPRSARMPG